MIVIEQELKLKLGYHLFQMETLLIILKICLNKGITITKQEETDLTFLLAQECPFIRRWYEVISSRAYVWRYLYKAKLREMLGVSLIDLDEELKNYEYPLDGNHN